MRLAIELQQLTTLRQGHTSSWHWPAELPGIRRIVAMGLGVLGHIMLGWSTILSRTPVGAVSLLISYNTILCLKGTTETLTLTQDQSWF